MDYQAFLPSEGLSSFVKNYFLVHIDAPQETFRTKMFPTGTAHLTFFLEGSHDVYMNNTIIKTSGVMLGRQPLKYFEFSSTRKSEFLGVTFHPAAIYNLFNIDAITLNNTMVPFAKYLSTEATTLFNTVKGSNTTEERIAVIENFLFKYRLNTRTPGIIDECISKIQESAGCILIEELVDKFKVSRRYLEKHFLRIVGTSPGKYSKFIRFSYIVKEIESNELRPEDLVARYNYYDQSHFIKDFELYMGEKPVTYYSKSNPVIAEVFRKRIIE